MSCPARLHPFRKPKNHRLPVPRWRLVLPNSISHVFTAYIGVQTYDDAPATSVARLQVITEVQEWLKGDDRPSAYECFDHIDGCDVQRTIIWVCYWVEEASYKRSLESLSLPVLYSNLTTPGRTSIGLWREAFATEATRLETNYSGLDYLPGLAKIPNTTTEEHEFATYWGAARDRIPDSAHDLFPPSSELCFVDVAPQGLGQYLVGTNCGNVTHIRSGQFWENCGQEEADAYETKLEPTLHTGLTYLWENPKESGARGLRYLRNRDASIESSPRPRKETCGAGFFTSLEALETWAKSHRSHLAIYRGALTHYKVFGDTRKMRTWHEVSVIRAGDARFEYVNCRPETGVIQSFPLEVREDRLESSGDSVE